eukprot:6746342-Prorocentrum_lima.AAC.1
MVLFLGRWVLFRVGGVSHGPLPGSMGLFFGVDGAFFCPPPGVVPRSLGPRRIVRYGFFENVLV